MADYDMKRQAKIARTLIRLKHSLAADDEIESYLTTTKQNLIAGEKTVLTPALKDIIGED